MNKMPAMIVAACVALTMSDIAAADKDQDSLQPQARQVADPAAGGATASEREWKYLAALQKCEAADGEDRTKCVDQARKKYGQM